MTLLHSGVASVLAFMACVALATYAQNLTGFAFSLILLGLVSVLEIATVADAANAAMVLTLINAWAYFRARSGPVPWRLVRPSMLGSAVGVALGVALLGWLSGSSLTVLRALLGVSILGCAALLLAQAKPRAEASGRTGFAVVGVLSGLLSGLFSTPGPPLVYYIYRQPLERELARSALLLMFAFSAVVRMGLVLPSGHFSGRAALLAACAVPVVFGVTRLREKIQPRLSQRALQWMVAGLLAVAGLTLLADAVRHIAF